jgi:hypothetical protein
MKSKAIELDLARKSVQAAIQEVNQVCDSLVRIDTLQGSFMLGK